MRFLALLLVAFGATSHISAQTLGTVRVTVLFDKDGSPLPGMDVTLAGGSLVQPRILVTNESGDVCFLGVPVGDGYVLKVSAPGFETKRGRIGRVYGSVSRNLLGQTGIVSVYGCSAIQWHDIALPPPGVFILPIPEQPQAGICM